MSHADTLYAARLGSEWLERGRDNLIKCQVYRDGALVAPSSGTVTIYDGSESAIVDGASVTISGSVAQYTVTAGTLPVTRELEGGYVVLWSLAMPDGVTHTFRTTGGLCRRALYMVLTETDLTAARSSLSNLRPSSKSTWQDYIDEAWRNITERLEASGRRAHLIMEPAALKAAHRHHSLELIFGDLAINGGPQFLDLSRDEAAKYRQAWSDLRFLYDEDDDGFASSSRRKQPAAATLWLC